MNTPTSPCKSLHAAVLCRIDGSATTCAAPVEVSKTVVGDVGDAPAEFTARLVCDDGTDSQITMPGTGGTGTPVPSVTVGSVCSLTELAGSIPPGWTVSYSVDGGAPIDTPPLFTVEDQTAVAVAIVNTAATTTTTTSTTTTTTSTTTPGTSTTAATSTTVSPTTIGPSTTAPPTIAPTSAAPPTTVGPQIPSTGAPTRSLVVFAAAALLAGAVLVVARRRITG